MPRTEYHDTPVVEFHEAFGAPIAWTPTVPPEDRRKLRIKLILEEALELAEASGYEVKLDNGIDRVELTPLAGVDPSILSAADALADLRYVVDGASLEWGVPLEKCLREVHRSNMSKLGEDGRPLLRGDGKILKGPHFTPPDLKTILELHGSLRS